MTTGTDNAILLACAAIDTTPCVDGFADTPETAFDLGILTADREFSQTMDQAGETCPGDSDWYQLSLQEAFGGLQPVLDLFAKLSASSDAGVDVDLYGVCDGPGGTVFDNSSAAGDADIRYFQRDTANNDTRTVLIEIRNVAGSGGYNLHILTGIPLSGGQQCS